MKRRPRALHVAPIMPARAGNGLAMRQGMFLEALARRFDTRLLVLPIAGGNAATTLPDELDVPVSVLPLAGRADTHFALLSQLADPAARLAAFRTYGRSSLAAYVSVSTLAALREAAGGEPYDLVHIGRSYLADAREAVAGGAHTLDLDEDEWTSYREVAAGVRGADPFAAAWAEAEADAMSRLIGRSAEAFARHFISSERDAGLVAARHPGIGLEVIENAIALPARRAAPASSDPASVLFVGSFGYEPNVDAITWFVDEIWPRVLALSGRPVCLRIVGRDAGRVAALTQRQGVESVGEVDDIATAYATATLVVAPLRAGAGTRLKLLEAAAHGVPIVTTTLGNRGLPFEHRRHLLIADDAAGFAAAMLEALADGEAGATRATAALALVQERYDRERAIERLACRLRDLAAT